ncbi:MAG TPA: hypothetical protein VE197_12615, partial [Mycobacterium sp.]|nr:hypothetical protein [Mycobacterium sp.]
MIARIRKTALLALGAVLATAAFGVAPAMAEFGMKSYDVTFTNEDGSPATQAGSHPFAMTTSFEVASYEIPLAERDSPVERFGPDGDIKDLFSEEVAGFAGDATAYPRCSTADYVEDNTNVAGIRPNCPDNTAVGVFGAYLFGPPPFVWGPAPVFNLVPAPGEVARLGFNIQNARVTLDVRVKSGGDYNVTVSSRGTSQYVPVFGGVLQLWGIPSDPAHDSIRGECLSKYVLASGAVNFAGDSVGECPVERIDKPFFTLPTNCEGPEATRYAANSWQNPGSYLPSGEPNLSDPAWASGEVFTHNAAIPPEPQGFTGCGLLPFKPSVTAEPTTKAADSPTGLDFSLHVHDEGLKNPEGLVQSAIKKVEVTLPEGMSANPSVAEGLGVCT